MKILIVCSSLNPESRSRQLAQELESRWQSVDFDFSVLDLREADSPMCDGGAVYEDRRVLAAKARVEDADAIVFAMLVYVYSANAAMKNFVELTGHSMKDKVAGFLCAAGGSMSYMSAMSLANSLMLDFRMFVLPRFVYVTAGDWEGDRLKEGIGGRIDQFAESFADFARRLSA